MPARTSFFRDDCGQDLIEYALIAALIGLGAIAAVRNLGTIIGNQLTAIGTSFQSAV